MNKYWTFQDKNQGISSQYIKFFLVSLIGLFLTELILYTLIYFLHFYDIYAKMAAVAVVIFWNFLVNKYWTFKPKI